ncbi:hypothetical protein ABAC402_07300 [Asticcacaulis sp. AC402]|nr:hypothetical protein ABAC402_07300 [Asticcacaulis sp. AC402]
MSLPFLTGGAAAQSIDYGSLEALFGEPVTTSATGSPQRSTEVPVDMTIISAEDIKRSGAHDLPTLLGRVPGIDVLNWSTYGADIGVRGYNQPMSPRLLVLVNGRQVYLDHYGYTAWSTIPVQLSEIRQIEVVKGPNAALFGFNAVSGVVNIITFNPRYDDVDGGSVSASSRNGSEASLTHTFRPASAIAARISAGASRADEWDNTLGSRAAGYRAEVSKATVNVDTVWTVSEKTEVRFETSLSNSQTNDMISLFEAVPSKYLTSSVKLGLTSDTKIGVISAVAYRNALKHNVFLVHANGSYDNVITHVGVQDLFKIGAKHTIRLGLEARNNELTTSPIAGGKVSYDVVSASAMWNWAVRDSFSVSAAVRNDTLSLKREGSFAPGFPLASNANWDRDISKVSYNLGAVWRVSDRDSLRLMAARGAQLPSLVELGGLQLRVPYPGFSVAFMGNPFLEPTVVDNLELSYDRTFDSGKLGVRVFSQKSEAIKGQPSSTALFQMPTLTSLPAVSWQNVADSEMTGFELSASGRLGQAFHWNADVTATDVTDEAYPGVALPAQKADFSRMTPKTRGNVGLGWAGGKWTVDTFLHYTGDFTSYTPSSYVVVEVPAHTTLAANVSYDLGSNMTIAASGQNLVGGKQVQTSGFKVPATVFVTLSKRW